MTLCFLRGKGKGNTEQSKGNINTVTLSPAGTVQENRGQEQNDKETDGCTQVTASASADKQKTGIGEDNVEKNTQEFDKIEIPDRRKREKSEEVQLRYIIVSYGFA